MFMDERVTLALHTVYNIQINTKINIRLFRSKKHRLKNDEINGYYFK